MNVSLNETGMAVFGLGFALGMRHAMDPDHVVAVSTIVSKSNSVIGSSVTGAFWGLGHTLSLFIFGMVVLALRLSISESFVATVEAAVAIMLIGLGIGALGRVIRSMRSQVKDRAVREHRHVLKTGLRSFLVGMVHGLAGTGGLMILVIATAPSFVAGSLYILIFGFGSIGGMLVLSSLISIPFVLSARFSQAFNHGLQLLTALLSIAFGVFWILSL